MLRSYQQKLKSDIYSAWQAGARNVLAVSPTGSGKTVTFADIIHDHVGQSVAIAHRQEIVGQISLQLGREGIEHKIIAPRPVILQTIEQHREELGKSFYNPNAHAAVAGVDTLVARKEKLADWAKQITLWTQDEAHHLLRGNKWGTGVAMFPNALGLGVTACTERADGKGLGIHADGVFHELVLGPTPRELIEVGHLSDYEIVLPKSDFDRNALRLGSNGDFTSASMKEQAEKAHIVGDVVDTYCQYAYGKRGIVFATDVESSVKIAERFNAIGIPAASVSAETKDRDKIIKAFKAGKIWVLINVDLFGEGFDVPAVEVVIMARPTKSLNLYLQQCGRALRIMIGKIRALIIDLVSNVKEHGLPDRPRHWSMSGRDRKKREKDPDEIPVTACTNCMKVYERVHRICPYCGHEPVPVGGGRSVEQVDGDLLLLDSDTLSKLRASIQLEAPGALAQRVGMAAGKNAAAAAVNRQIERIQEQQRLSDAIALWAGGQRALGRSDSESHRRFYHWIGCDVLTALSGTREEMEKIRDKIDGSTESLYPRQHGPEQTELRIDI